MEAVCAEGGGGEMPPAVVVYRSVKYSGLVGRTWQYIATYSRFYLLRPTLSSFYQFRQLLYEILGFFLILLTSPFLLASFLALWLVRRLRTHLVRQFYPNSVICEDWLPRCILVGRSLGMVTAVVWTRGKVDVELLRQRFQRPRVPADSILHKRPVDKFGMRVWLETPEPFDINNHVIQAPPKFYNVPITDSGGSHSHYGSKSALQKYVTSCASQKMGQDLSPWQIYVIPQSGTEKERTCCVLRFHYILLNDPAVRKTLDGLFVQKLKPRENALTLDRHVMSSVSRNSCSSLRDNNCHLSSTNSSIQLDLNDSDKNVEFAHPSGNSYKDRTETSGKSEDTIKDYSEGNILDEPLEQIASFQKTLLNGLTKWINRNLVLTRSDFRTWLVLRMKQFRFHTKRDLLKVVALELFAKWRVAIDSLAKLPEHQIWVDLKEAIGAAFLIFRACCNIPAEMGHCLLSRNSGRANGFHKTVRTATRQISWSAPISAELVEAIKEKTDCSLESIVLTACALALKFYYLEMSLPNPKTVGVAAPVLTSDLLSLTGFKNFDLPTTDFSIPCQLKRVESVLSEYPRWKLMGMYYLSKYISHFLPRSLAYIVTRRVMKRYPLTFNFLNFESPLPVFLPHISLWGHSVDEFTFWRTPHSDFCVSATLVKYGGMIKLAVLSPMKSVDTALTQKFSSHLNAIAEAVGVEKCKIPYSRKSSPTSSLCASPSILKASL